MTARPDSWLEAYREILRRERGRIGEWPTEQSLLAFSRQELPPSEAGKIRRFLVAYPEVAAALAELDEPLLNPAPDALESLSDLEIEQDWARLMNRVERESPSPSTEHAPQPSRPPKGFRDRPSPAWWLGSLAASAAAFALGSLVPVSTFLEPSPPIALRGRLLIPDGQRGAAQAPMPVAPDGRDGEILLNLGSLEARTFDEYRLSIHEIRDGREIERFRRRSLPRNEAGAFDLLLRRGSLSPGLYRLRLFGAAGGTETLLATYSIRLE